MQKENLPLALLERNQDKLGLTNPVIFDSEDALFVKDVPEIKEAVVFLPKSKPLITMTLSLVAQRVQKGGTVILAGENKAGIRSAKDAYEACIGPITEKIVGNHSALYVGKNERRAEKTQIDDFFATTSITYTGTNKQTPITLSVSYLPGVFNRGALDAGTRLLLDHIPYGLSRIVDVGCGAGIIGSVYKKISPESTVVLCDKSPLAVRSAERTVKENSLDVSVYTSNVLSSIMNEQTFDLIVSNPPFHDGIATDYGFMETLAQEARNILAPHGMLYIVANSFLSYERVLEKESWSTETIADNGSYKIIKATRP